MLLKSNIDNSVNFVIKKENGFFEARYVRRTNDYFIVYLSSQTGCKQACRFCHLTASKQTMDDMATLSDIEEQARLVLEYHQQQAILPPLVHFNFMARGEPLLNPTIVNRFNDVYTLLSNLANEYNLDFKIKISSIIPKGVENLSFLNRERVDFYYSLYSTDMKFRKRWIPNGIDPIHTGSLLKSLPSVVLHHTFIEGENDSYDNVDNIAEWLKQNDLNVGLNIVRYNPYDDKRGVESAEDKIHRLTQRLCLSPNILFHRIVPRVGLDVYASCGMFIEK